MSQAAAETERATFAAGCFWGVEHKFRQIRGVLSTRVGFSGGQSVNPTYLQVCRGNTGHAESVDIVFDPRMVSYEQLLDFFFGIHDPSQLNGQGPDIGDQYRSAVYYHSPEQKAIAEKKIEELERSGRFNRPIATRALPASDFYEAEEYHQQYYEKLEKKKK